MPSVHDLLFGAPIPRGNEVLVATFTLEERSSTLVLDRTTSTLYCPEELWGALQQDTINAVREPVGVITRWSWKVKGVVIGTCVGAIVSTTTRGEQQVRTRLLVEPGPAAPYR